MKKQVWSGLFTMMLVLAMTTAAFAGAKVKKTEAKFRNGAVMVRAELSGLADSATIEIAKDKNFKKKVITLDAELSPCDGGQTGNHEYWGGEGNGWKFSAEQIPEWELRGVGDGEWKNVGGVKKAELTSGFSKKSSEINAYIEAKASFKKGERLYVRIKPFYQGCTAGKTGKTVKASYSKTNPTKNRIGYALGSSD